MTNQNKQQKELDCVQITNLKTNIYSYIKLLSYTTVPTIIVVLIFVVLIYFILEYTKLKTLLSEHIDGWLSFFGALIAAIVPIILLFFTYKQNNQHLLCNFKQQNKVLFWQHKETQLKYLEDLIIENNTVFCVQKYIQNIQILDQTQTLDIHYKQLHIINSIEILGVQKAKNDMYHLISEDSSNECKEYFDLVELIYYEYYVYLNFMLFILELLLKKEENGNNMEQAITIMSDQINENISKYQKYNEINSSYIQNIINFMQKLNYSRQLSDNDIIDRICDITEINSKIIPLTKKGFNLIKHKNDILVAEINKII